MENKPEFTACKHDIELVEAKLCEDDKHCYAESGGGAAQYWVELCREMLNEIKRLVEEGGEV